MLAVLAVVVAIGSTTAEAGRQPIREGARVQVLLMEDPGARVATRGERPLVGRVVSVQGESVTVETSRRAVVIPFERIARLEVSHRSRNLKRGALIGGLVGFAVVTTFFVAAFDEDDDYAISTADSFALGAILGLPAGGVIGLGVGALAPSWHAVPVPKAKASRQASLALTLRF